MGAAASIGNLVESLPNRVSFEECVAIFGKEAIPKGRFNLFIDEDDKISKALLLRLAAHKFDCFLTHNWANDESGRNNHDRVAKVNEGERIDCLTYIMLILISV
jgi:hypothetical protein